MGVELPTRCMGHFVTEKLGLDGWKEVQSRAKIQDHLTVLDLRQHEDKTSLRLIAAAFDVLKLSRERGMESFGEHFADFSLKSGLGGNLKALGPSLFDLIMNLNLVHNNVMRDLRSGVFPSFSIEKMDRSRNTVELVCRFHRSGMEHFARGLLRRAALLLYRCELAMELLSVTYAEDDHIALWRLSWRSASGACSCGLTMASPPPSSWGFGLWHEALSSFSSLFCRPASSEVAHRDDDSDDDVVKLPGFDGSASLPLRSVGQLHRRLERHLRKVGLESLKDLDPLLVSPDTRGKAAGVLFSWVKAKRVAAPWNSEAPLKCATAFWGRYDKLGEYAKWSERTAQDRPTQPVYFLSHSWKQPENWDELMGPQVLYAEIKAAEICGLAKAIAKLDEEAHTTWQDVRFWIDKCCIPQSHPALLLWSVSLIEEFIQLCDGMVVLLTWSYFKRLWCVYEWACCLVCLEPQSIMISADAFLRYNTLGPLLASIRSFSLANCECEVPSDRQILVMKVKQYYVSEAHFDDFLRFSAIALIVRTLVGQAQTLQGTVAPWLELALECGYYELAIRLGMLERAAISWSHKDIQLRKGSPDKHNSTYQARVHHFFNQEIQPLMLQMRTRSLLHTAQNLKRLRMPTAHWDPSESASEGSVMEPCH